MSSESFLWDALKIQEKKKPKIAWSFIGMTVFKWVFLIDISPEHACFDFSSFPDTGIQKIQWLYSEMWMSFSQQLPVKSLISAQAQSASVVFYHSAYSSVKDPSLSKF